MQSMCFSIIVMFDENKKIFPILNNIQTNAQSVQFSLAELKCSIEKKINISISMASQAHSAFFDKLDVFLCLYIRSKEYVDVDVPDKAIDSEISDKKG
ncbi:hypothetical protein T06_14657 [Trichinella sp. T6]|nr:hypothetical protein T06_14657 [Trichinella sp. T6]